MPLKKPLFSLHGLERYQIHVPATHPRGQHPQDYHNPPVYKEALRMSSAGQHMHIDTAGFSGDPLGRSTQWGAHFDTPFHFDSSGAYDIERSLVHGPARVIDLRQPLTEASDGLAITSSVVRRWVENGQKNGLFSDSQSDRTWERLLVRTLDDAQALSKISLHDFPHFESPEAVQLLLDSIRNKTGVAVRVVFNEPPSVDAARQGFLLNPDPQGKGGAHGAFHHNGVIIGENWDFNGFQEGDRGITQVFFDPNLADAKDAAIVAGAYFIPESNLTEVQWIFRLN